MKSLALVSLGCDKNLVDSEVALGKLLSSGFQILTSPEEADLVLVNTCAFITPACQESESWIERVIGFKHDHPNQTIAVMGCYVQRYGNQLSQKYPEVDYWIGVNDFPKIVDILSGRNGRVYVDEPLYLYNELTERLLSTPSHYAYLKISEGCSHRCSFCVIPSIRGKQRSRTIESIQKEAMNLVHMGVKEIILIGQDIGSYGLDWEGKRRLSQLLRVLDRTLPGGIWLRLLYLSPDSIDPELIETLATSEKICKYLDLPLQHIHPDILRSMNRSPDIDRVFDHLNDLRRSIPGLFLRTTLMVGFPGESEPIFDALVSFVKSFRFERLGCFTYSEQPGTPATRLPSPVEETIKQERYKKIMKIQEKIVSDFHRSLVGTTIEVILDHAPVSKKKSTFIGRTYGDAPDVDGRIKLVVDHKTTLCRPGDILKATIIKSDRYDLEGVYP